jgi:Domain of unknown function (DUF6378)
MTDRYSSREELLDEAKRLVSSDRNVEYGEPTADFDRIAGMMNTLGYRGPGGRNIMSHDVAIIQICLKLSRLSWKWDKMDTWADILGYGACGWECVENEK